MISKAPTLLPQHLNPILALGVLLLFYSPILLFAQEGEEVEILDPFEVEVPQDSGYTELFSAEATRMNVPIQNIPISVDVHNRNLLEDTMAFTLREGFDYNASLYVATWEQPGYRMRGFLTTANNVNGLPISEGNGQAGVHSVANIERLEFLKGPQAVLYGSGNFGGTVNRVTKVPQPEFEVKARAIYGAYDFYRLELDVTGPLKKWGDDGAGIFYRMNYSWEDSEFYRNWMYIDETLIAPSLLFRFSERTSLKVDYWRFDSKRPANYVLPVTPDGILGGIRLAPPGTFDDPTVGTEIITHEGNTVRALSDYDPLVQDGPLVTLDPSEAWIHPSAFRGVVNSVLMADFRHTFNETFALRFQYAFEDWDEFDEATLPITQGGFFRVTETEAFFDTWYREIIQLDKAHRMRLELLSQFNTGPISHRLLIGTNAEDITQYDYLWQDRGVVPNTVNRYRDILNPEIEWYFDRPSLQSTGASLLWDWENTIENQGYYANNVMGFFDDRVFAQVGYRWSENDFQRTAFTAGGDISQSADSDTISWGVVGHLNKDETLTAYFNANEGFQHNFHVNPDGSTLPPQTGEQLELGLKFSLLENQLNGLVTVFNIDQEGVAQADPDPTRVGYQIVRPGLTAEGLEFSVNYRPAPNWYLLAEYAYVDMEDQQSGDPYFDYWPHKFTFMTRYEVMEGSLAGFFGTVGFIHQRDHLTDPNPSAIQWTHPDYNRLDLGIGYKWRGNNETEHSFQFHIRNVTDQKDLIVRSAGIRYLPEPGLMWRLEYKLQY